MSKAVYLAGPVRNLDDGGLSWRREVRDVLEDYYEIESPLDKYNPSVEDVEVVDEAVYSDDSKVGYWEIVRSDKNQIDNSDILFVGHRDVQMIGTPMEVMYAYERDIPIVIWDIDNVGEENMSPWFRKHANVIESDLQSLAIAMGVCSTCEDRVEEFESAGVEDPNL